MTATLKILAMALAGSAGLIVLARIIYLEQHPSGGVGALPDEEAAGFSGVSHFPDQPSGPAAATNEGGRA